MGEQPEPETAVFVVCPHCGGEGEVGNEYYTEQPCRVCNGYGIIEDGAVLISEDDMDEQEAAAAMTSTREREIAEKIVAGLADAGKPGTATYNHSWLAMEIEAALHSYGEEQRREGFREGAEAAAKYHDNKADRIRGLPMWEGNDAKNIEAIGDHEQAADDIRAPPTPTEKET